LDSRTTDASNGCNKMIQHSADDERVTLILVATVRFDDKDVLMPSWDVPWQSKFALELIHWRNDESEIALYGLIKRAGTGNKRLQRRSVWSELPVFVMHLISADLLQPAVMTVKPLDELA